MYLLAGDFVKFDGKWNSLGGEKKVCRDSDIFITWWEKRKFLLVEGKQAKRITKLLIVILTNTISLRSSGQPGDINKDLSNLDEINLVNSCSCKRNSLISKG